MKNVTVLVLAFISLTAHAEWHEAFKAGDRVFDSRSYKAGSVVRTLDSGAVEVSLDGSSTNKIFKSYYAADLGPQIETCIGQLCVGDSFNYTLPVIGNNREGQVVEIFQGSDGRTDDNRYGKVVYAVKFKNESSIRFLNSDHLEYMNLK